MPMFDLLIILIGLGIGGVVMLSFMLVARLCGPSRAPFTNDEVR